MRQTNVQADDPISQNSCAGAIFHGRFRLIRQLTVAFLFAVAGLGCNPAAAQIGTQGFLTASPPFLNFGSLPVETTSAYKVIKIQNIGVTPVTVLGYSTVLVAASKGDSELEAFPQGLVSSDCYLLATGASCSFQIKYKPNSPGIHNAGLSIISNASNGTLVVPLTGTGCTTYLVPTSASVPATGGNGFNLPGYSSTCVDEYPAGLNQAQRNVPWIHLDGDIGPVYASLFCLGLEYCPWKYSVDPNPNPTPRTGTITVHGQTFTVNQAAAAAPPPPSCVYTMNPTSASYPAAGGSGSFTISIPNTCITTGEIILQINHSWIHITNGLNQGNGRFQYFGNSATVNYTVDANLGSGADIGTITKTGGGPTFTVNQAGTAGPGPGGPAVSVIEYYNASLDHYFITWIQAEIALLDAGTQIKGWVRTGQSFKAYTTAQAGTSPVCRFYIPPGLGDSHFFGRGTTECNATGQKNPSFVLEDPVFMHMFLPNVGTCAAGTTPIYRVFSNRPDANHRYMTDPAIRDQMVVRRWLAEGDGPNLVVMCAPQ